MRPARFNRTELRRRRGLGKTNHRVTPIQTKGHVRREKVFIDSTQIEGKVGAAASGTFREIGAAKMHQPRPSLDEEGTPPDADTGSCTCHKLHLAKIAGR